MTSDELADRNSRAGISASAHERSPGLEMAQYRSWRSLRRLPRSLQMLPAVFFLMLVLGCGTPERAEPMAAAPTPVGAASLATANPSGSADAGSTARPGGNDTQLVPEALSPRILVSWRQEGRSLVLVDVRAKWLCDQDRIPGALCIPTGELEARLSDLPRDGEIVVYGGGYGDTDAAEVRTGAQLLLKQGFAKVYELQGGLADYAVVTLPSCGCKP
jgi:rhodanese-related sulfurtransferase